MALKEELHTPTSVEKNTGVLRENFGPGHLGQQAFEWIFSGTATCQALMEDGSPCGKPAIGTTDFDTFGDPTLVAHCSLEHDAYIIRQIRESDSSRAQTSIFGRNGFGRA